MTTEYRFPYGSGKFLTGPFPKGIFPVKGEADMEQGLWCDILKNKNRDGDDCSNGGLSSRHKSVILLGYGPFEPCAKAPAVRLVRRDIGGREYLHAEPVDPPPAGHTPYMAGGTFIHTCDGRFPSDYPIPLHDRTDTWEDYRLLTM